MSILDILFRKMTQCKISQFSIPYLDIFGWIAIVSISCKYGFSQFNAAQDHIACQTKPQALRGDPFNLHPNISCRLLSISYYPNAIAVSMTMSHKR